MDRRRFLQGLATSGAAVGLYAMGNDAVVAASSECAVAVKPAPAPVRVAADSAHASTCTKGWSPLAQRHA